MCFCCWVQFFVLSIVLPVMSFGWPSEYTVRDLETLQSDHSDAIWINDNGDVLGKYSFQGEERVFIWSSSKGLRALYFPMKVIPKKLTNTGKILLVAPEELISNGTRISSSRSFVWDTDNGLAEITNQNGTAFHATDINDQGAVIGVFYEDGQHHTPCIIYNNRIIDLENLSGDLGIQTTLPNPMFLNNNMDVVGQCYRAIVYKGRLVGNKLAAVAWRADSDWEISELVPLSTQHVWAHGLNDYGIALCRTENYLLHLVDVFTKNRTQLQISCGPTSFNNGNYFIAGGEVAQSNHIGADTLEVAQHHYLSDFLHRADPKKEFWKERVDIKCINSKGVAVGNAQNVYGETHAIMFVPQAR